MSLSQRLSRIPLTAAGVAALSAWKRQQAAEKLKWGAAWAGEGWVFTREDGTPHHPGMVTKAFGDAVAASGLPRIQLHDLRHTSATLGLAAGVPAKAMNDRLGHADISITLDVYSHVIRSMEEEASAQIETQIFG